MNKHLNNWLDEQDGLAPETTNKNIQKEIDETKRTQPAFYAELKKQGFIPSEHTDDKTGKPFIGWSKGKTIKPTIRQKTKEFMDNFFFYQVKKGQMKWELDQNWLSIYFEETLTATGGEKKFSLLCAQSLEDYSEVDEDGVVYFNSRPLLDRIHTMLFEALRSCRQDVNILLTESK